MNEPTLSDIRRFCVSSSIRLVDDGVGVLENKNIIYNERQYIYLLRSCSLVELYSSDIGAGKRIAKPLVVSSKHVDDGFFGLILVNDDEDDFRNVICWLLLLLSFRFLLFCFEVSSILVFVGDVLVSIDCGNVPQ